MSFRNKIFARLSSLEIINSPPAAMKKSIKLLDEDETSVSALTGIINDDPGLSSRILKIANSSFCGNCEQTGEIDRAVEILGHGMTKYLIFSLSIQDRIISISPGREKENWMMWRHILETAFIARNIAAGTGCATEGEAYAAGLLHDLGRFFLVGYFARETHQVNRLVRQGKFLVDAENEILGVDHQQIGRYIAEKWNLTEPLSAVIGNHHPDSHRDINNLPSINRAVILADSLSFSGDEIPDNAEAAAARARLINGCSKALGLEPADIERYFPGIFHDVMEYAAGVSIDLGDKQYYSSEVNLKLFRIYFDLISAFREKPELSERCHGKENARVAPESLRVALAAISHYINNAAMNISGLCDILSILHQKGETGKVIERIPEMTGSIKASLRRISLVLEELSNITAADFPEYFDESGSADIEKSLKQRIESVL